MLSDPRTKISDQQIATLLGTQVDKGVRCILDIHGPRILWLLKNRFGDVLQEADLLAVLNEAAFRAVRSIQTYDDSKGTLSAWFWQIAMNAARSLLSDEMRHSHQSLHQYTYEQDRLLAPHLEEPDTASDQMLADLLEAIEALPDLQRKVIKADLASSDVASAAWLARRYGTTEGSIYVSRKKAKENLRRAMRSRGYFQDQKE